MEMVSEISGVLSDALGNFVTSRRTMFAIGTVPRKETLWQCRNIHVSTRLCTKIPDRLPIKHSQKRT